MKFMISMIFLAVLAAPSAFGREEPIKLYKEFVFGMGYDEVRHKAGVQDATTLGIPSVLLYREGEEFGGEKWTQLFEFHNNSLISVILASEKIESYQPAVLTIAHSGFTLDEMTSLTNSLDCLTLATQTDQSTLIKRIEEFEKTALEEGYLELLYVDNSSISKILPYILDKKTQNEILENVPPNTRMINVIVTTDEETGLPRIVIGFATPVHAIGIYREDF